MSDAANALAALKAQAAAETTGHQGNITVTGQTQLGNDDWKLWQPGAGDHIANLSTPKRSADGSIPGATNADTPENIAFREQLHHRNDTRGLDEMTAGLTIPGLYSAPGATMAALGIGAGTRSVAKAAGVPELPADALGMIAGGYSGRLLPGLSKGLPKSVVEMMNVPGGGAGTRLNNFISPPPEPVPTAPIPPVRYNPQAPEAAALQYTPPPLRFNPRPQAPAPQTAPIPPVRYNAPPTAPPVQTAPIPPVKYIPRGAPEPTAPAPAPQSSATQMGKAIVQAQEPMPVTEAPRSRFTATGETKSPQLRGQEIKGANIEAKGQRWATAMQDPSVLPALKDILVSKGLLQPGETIPNESLPRLLQLLGGQQ